MQCLGTLDQVEQVRVVVEKSDDAFDNGDKTRTSFLTTVATEPGAGLGTRPSPPPRENLSRATVAGAIPAAIGWGPYVFYVLIERLREASKKSLVMPEADADATRSPALAETK